MESGVRACMKYILIQQSKLFKHVKVMFYAISLSEICVYCCPVIHKSMLYCKYVFKLWYQLLKWFYLL